MANQNQQGGKWRLKTTLNIACRYLSFPAAGGGSAFRFGRNIRTWEDSK